MRRSPRGGSAPSADIEIVAARDRELARAAAADQEALNVAGVVEGALRDGDQRAGERLAPSRDEDQCLDAPVAGPLLELGRNRDRLTARQQAVLAVVEAHDLVHPLDADIERAAVLGERFGVVPAPRRERLAVRTEDRRHLGVGDAGRPVAVVDDAAAQPAALVGDGEKTRAVAPRRGCRRCRRIPCTARSARSRRGTRAGRTGGVTDRAPRRR